jgi:hypothetical protein
MWVVALALFVGAIYLLKLLDKKREAAAVAASDDTPEA